MGNDLEMTHEFLALMMGVRRAGVTETVGEFKKAGLINSFRGGLTMIDRKGIEKIAGHFYGIPEKEYRRLIRSS